MKKKILALTLIIALIGIICYFKPIATSGLLNENQTIQIAYSNIGVKEGEPYINSETFNEITDEQKSSIIEQLENYTYRRKWNTLFTSGAFSDLGEHLMHIYIYEGDKHIDSYAFNASNECVIDGKNYVMEKSKDFVESVLDIVR